MKPTALLSALFLFVILTQDQQPSINQRVTAQDQTGLITLERGVCFGTCPSYMVTLAADGSVTWEGRDFVRTKGKATAHIKPEAFNKRVREFERIKFATLDYKYEPGTRGCPQP